MVNRSVEVSGENCGTGRNRGFLQYHLLLVFSAIWISGSDKRKKRGEKEPTFRHHSSSNNEAADKTAPIRIL